MSINLSKLTETPKKSIETQQVWLEMDARIESFDCVGSDTDYQVIDIILENEEIKTIDIDDINNYQMFINEYGWIDVSSSFTENETLFIIENVKKFRKLITLPKIKKTKAELDKDTNAEDMRLMFFESLLPNIEKAIKTSVAFIYVGGYLSDDMKKWLKDNKSLYTSYDGNINKTKIYW